MNRTNIGFAAVGSTLSILFLIVVNYLTSPNYLWFIYPTFVLMLWPMSLFFIKGGHHKLHSVFGSILVILFLLILNQLHSPNVPWFIYAIYPVIWWPIFINFSKHARSLNFALIGSICTIAYYTFFNVLISPQYPWAIYPAFAILWWPLSIYYSQKKNYFGLSVSASLLTAFFFLIVNIVSSPQIIWAVYPIFAVLWWPLSMYYYQYKKEDIRPEKKG